MNSTKRLRFKIAKTNLRKGITWYQHLHLKSEDTVIASYPRSGSTWLRFQLYEILSGKVSEFAAVENAIPGVNKRNSATPVLTGEGCLIQTHEPFRRNYRKGIYLIRDPRDVAISEYYFLKRKGFFRGELDMFVEEFLHGRVNPFCGWEKHVNTWFDAKIVLRDNLLIIYYEIMRKEPKETIIKVIDFLGVKISSERIEYAIENNSIDKMRDKEDNTPKKHFKIQHPDIRFVRNGNVGGWRETLSEHQKCLFEQCLSETLTRTNYPIK